MQFVRICRVGLVYLAYGVIILTTVYVLVPVRRWWRPDGARDVAMQGALSRAAGALRRVATALDVIEMSVVGAEHLAGPGTLLVANHPSILDATLLTSLVPQLDHVVEVSWARNPIMRRAVARAGYLLNDDPRAVIAEGARRLAAGRCLVVFPEGTRSPVGALHPFRRGAARVALASGRPLVPVVIRCDPPFGQKGRPWYDVPPVTPRLVFTIGEPIAPGPLVDDGDSSGVAARKVTRALEAHFRRTLGYVDA